MVKTSEPVKRMRRSRYYFENLHWGIRKAIEKKLEHYANGPFAEKMAYILHKDLNEMLQNLADGPAVKDRT